jgi:hypothetical protein
MTTRTTALAGAVWMVALAANAQGPTMPERRMFVAQINHPGPGGMDCAVLRDGGLVAVATEGQSGLTVRFFDPLGDPRGAALVVSDHAWSPRVAARGDGFVVVWEDSQSVSLPRGQAFSATGARVGAEFAVGLGTINEGLPRVLGTPDGGFVVAWTALDTPGGEGADAFARLYSPSGVAGPAFRVNEATAHHQMVGSLTGGDGLGVAADGSFMVVWSARDATQGLGVVARRFDASGNPQGGDIQVSANTSDGAASVAVAADGTRLVVWPRGVNASASDVFARRFDAAGVPLGPEFKVNVEAGLNLVPVVVAGPSSSFTIAWRHAASADPAARPTTRVVASDGSFAGPPALAGVTTAEILHAASDLAAGHALCWYQQDLNPGGGDPFTGVLMRRYAAFAPDPAVVDPQGSGGNGVLDPGERVPFQTVWRNHGEAVPASTGQVLTFGGPGAPAFTLYDDLAAYGAAAPGATTGCAAAGDCYEVGVAFWPFRPALHWDVSLDERLSTGQLQRWRVHVGRSFWDVGQGSPYYRFVETLLHQGVTSGCGPQTSTGDAPFCPTSAVSREQIAPFVLVAREGSGYRPFAPTGPPTFTDVPASSPFFVFIEELARRGIVSGCAQDAFCPQRAVTRAEASVIVLRTLDPGLTPPACGTPVFQDVPASSPFCPWVEELARRSIVGGCGDGLFCPDASLTREQMAVVLTQAFGLRLYGY